MPAKAIDFIPTLSVFWVNWQGHRIGYIGVGSFGRNPERQLEQGQAGKVLPIRLPAKMSNPPASEKNLLLFERVPPFSELAEYPHIPGQG